MDLFRVDRHRLPPEGLENLGMNEVPVGAQGTGLVDDMVLTPAPDSEKARWIHR